MTDEPDNPDEGTDNVALSEADTPETWDYHDPDEDNVEDPVEEGTDEEPVEGEEAQETEESEDETEEETPELITLEGGAQVTIDDLKQGYLRQSDYTRKAQSLSNDRKELEANVHRLEGVTQAFIDHIASLVPAEPDPALALRDPNKYTAQKAQYDAAVAQVQKLIDIGSQPKEIGQSLSQEDRQRALQEENQKLVSLFPQTSNQKGRERFFEDVQTAANEIGFSTDELRQVTDHRLFALAHWAKIGMEAEKNRAKAKAKVEKAPPATPRKPGQGTAKASKNKGAMQKLARTGSIHDAVAVDWV